MDLNDDLKDIMESKATVHVWMDPENHDAGVHEEGKTKSLLFLIALAMDSLQDRTSLKTETMVKIILCYLGAIRLIDKATNRGKIDRSDIRVNEDAIMDAMKRMKEKKDGKSED